jgi:methyl-galactoside transport system substrate-binding protein
MKILKKIIILVTLSALITSMFIGAANTSSTVKFFREKQIKAAVIFFSFDDPYMSLVRSSLKELGNKPASNIKYTFYDGKNDQNIQSKIIDSTLDDDYDLLLLNLVSLDKSTIESVINKAKEKNIPLVLFNTAPFLIEPVKSYNRAVVISTDAIQSGVLQGNRIIDEWNSNKTSIDKNGDGILQYFMLKGPDNSTVTTARSLYSILTVNNAGIRTQEILSTSCSWEKKCAEDYTESLFLKYGSRIEAIISNNDAMAIGAIEALQKYGYNTGDKSKYIPVFGIDGIPEAKELIDKDIMTGTVYQDPNELAEALYTIGLNLANNVDPLENTNYKFDETGITITIPYHEYK